MKKDLRKKERKGGIRYIWRIMDYGCCEGLSNTISLFSPLHDLIG